MTGPLGPTLTDLGQQINPFGDAAHELKVVTIGPDTDIATGWIIPNGAIEDVTPLPGADTYGQAPSSEWARWRDQVGAISAGRQWLRLSLQGGSPKAVTLHDMDVTADCQAPVRGIHVLQRGAGGLPSRHFAIVLDAPGGPTVKPYGKTGEETPDPEPADFPFFVSESELEHFVLDVSAYSRSCTWRAVLHWSVDGQQGTTEIGNNDAAFRLTAPTAATNSYLPDGTRLPT